MTLAAWQRASLPMLVLGVLAAEPRHGYAISQALVEAGLQPIRGAQLYPALARLEEAGAVDASWEASGPGPARKVYSLTDAGREQLVVLRDEWRAFTAAADALTIAPGRRGAVPPG